MEPAVLAQRFVDAFNARDEAALRALYRPDARIKRPTWPATATSGRHWSRSGGPWRLPRRPHRAGAGRSLGS